MLWLKLKCPKVPMFAGGCPVIEMQKSASEKLRGTPLWSPLEIKSGLRKPTWSRAPRIFDKRACPLMSRHPSVSNYGPVQADGVLAAVRFFKRHSLGCANLSFILNILWIDLKANSIMHRVSSMLSVYI